MKLAESGEVMNDNKRQKIYEELCLLSVSTEQSVSFNERGNLWLILNVDQKIEMLVAQTVPSEA